MDENFSFGLTQSSSVEKLGWDIVKNHEQVYRGDPGKKLV